MTVSTLRTRMRNLLRWPHRPARHLPHQMDAPRELESTELARYDLVCPTHRKAPTAGAVVIHYPLPPAHETLVYDLMCPAGAGHFYLYKRSGGRVMSPADLSQDYLACPSHDTTPTWGLAYFRDTGNPMREILVRELTCPVGNHTYLWQTDGG